MTDVGLDLRQRHRELLAGEADGIAFGAGAGRTADAVHVVGSILRQVEIEDVADVRNMQAARGHIGGDQHREISIVKVTQEAQALGLRHIAGNRLGIETIGVQHRFPAALPCAWY